ncbi:hypothetical protein A6D6_04127 [Alcanivorax xiamenensis]|uniref:Endolytic murein transglycosylase n=1 Tax=Alcanivorax xiamenensis TaxID=1177156 RepID=A0ABQ6Y2C8_9GAMM|nr:MULTISPECIES: endolytic transglycosylase MltG [Alcanivorax]KAF0802164.1 hypothetical protein A6D6_04127 [Alcanivorax xiamenensis]
MRRKIRIFALLLVFVIVAIPLAGFWVSGYLHRPLPVTEARLVQVPAGTGFSHLMSRLQGEGLLGGEPESTLRRVAGRLYSRFTGIEGRMHVGEYQLFPGDSLLTLLERIDRGEVMQRSVTLVEGWTFRQFRTRLAELEGLTVTLDGVDDEEVMARLGMPDTHPEGWFAPDTYFYTAGTSDVELLRRALERQRKILDEAWLGRDDKLPYDDPYQALIMASIVERETGVPKERGQIAGVFVNRLRLGMRLQTDPTVIYGMGERYAGRIGRADLRESTPYNTYVITGLPPTPIAMPGRDAIFAAVHPQQTKALYFVARGDGSHTFSNTLAEHRRAVRQYQLNRRDDYRSSPGAAP